MEAPGYLQALCICLVLLLCMTGVRARVDPATNRIRMLMIGETTAEHQTATSYMFADPKIDLRLVPAGDIADPRTSQRFMRIYFPRSKEKLIEGFDVIELFDFVPYILDDSHITWMRDAIRDEGLGLALTEMGWYDVSDWTGNDAGAWMATVIYEAYPVDLVLGVQNADTPFMKIQEETPLVDLPEFERTQLTGVSHHGLQIARPGSVVHTVWKSSKEDAIVSGEFGAGASLMIPMGWDNVPRTTEVGWFYYVDFVLNHAYFVAQAKVPEDLEVIHALRASFVRYRDERSVLTSLMEFVDKFGANTKVLEEMIAVIEEEKEGAEYLYLTDDYSAAWETMNGVLDRFNEISDEAVKIRERALLWVYITEWFVVTGTMIICGSVLWALMIRRRLYREVAVTRRRL
jgi:hypothetical protein